MSDEEEANVVKPLRSDSKVDRAAKEEEEGSGNSWGFLDVVGAAMYLAFAILLVCAAALSHPDNYEALDDDATLAAGAINSLLGDDVVLVGPRVKYPWAFMIVSTGFFGLFLCTELCTRCKHGCCAIITTLGAFIGNSLWFTIALIQNVPKFTITNTALMVLWYAGGFFMVLFFGSALFTDCRRTPKSLVKIADSSFALIASVLICNCGTGIVRVTLLAEDSSADLEELQATNLIAPNFLVTGSVFYVVSAVFKFLSFCVSK